MPLAYRFFKLSALALFPAFACAAGVSPAGGGEARKPNIVLIVMDSARADRLSCYGYRRRTTPRIDALAAKGVLFENFFANSTSTDISVPQLLSSRYFVRRLFRFDLDFWGAPQLSPDELALEDDAALLYLPPLLSSAGYRTAMITDHSGIRAGSELAGLFGEFKDNAAPGYAAEWIKRNAGSRFFLYVHVFAPHARSYAVTPPEKAFISSATAPGLEGALKKAASGDFSTLEGWTAEEIAAWNDLYDGGMLTADAEAGAVYDALTEAGLAEDTVIAVTADHGEALGQHGTLGHGGVPWDAVTRVPFILYYPRRLPGGARRGGIAETVDIYPTLLELAGVRLPRRVDTDGRSLAGMAAGGKPPKDYAFTRISLRSGRYKFFAKSVWDGRTVPALFDVSSDPGEQKDVASERPREVSAFSARHEKIGGKRYRRFMNSRRKAPPEMPFIVRTYQMKFSPKIIVEQVPVWKPVGVQGSAAYASGAPWLLKAGGEFAGLVRNPDSAVSAELELSVPMPDGDYEVSLFMQSEGSYLPGPELMKFGFVPGEPPASTGNFTPAPGDGEGRYLELGRVRVRDGLFVLRTDFPPAQSPYRVRHLLFREPGAPRPAPGERSWKLEEALRAAGYLER